MVVKIDGVENKDFGKDKNLFLKFLKENTSSGKVSAQVKYSRLWMCRRILFTG